MQAMCSENCYEQEIHGKRQFENVESLWTRSKYKVAGSSRKPQQTETVARNKRAGKTKADTEMGKTKSAGTIANGRVVFVSDTRRNESEV